MSNYHDIRLPNFIAVCATGGPYFSTKLAITNSGREIRLSERQYAFQKYKIKNCILNHYQFAEFNSFFRNRHGMRYCFRFRDFADYKVTKQLMAEYPSNETSFEFVKFYNDGKFTHQRPIVRPILDSLDVLINEEKIEPIIDEKELVITIPKQLGPGEKLFVSFEFDVNVRFYSDHFSYHVKEDGSICIDDLDLIEVPNDN